MEWVLGVVLIVMLLAGALKGGTHAPEADPNANLDGMSLAHQWQINKVFQSGRTELVGLFEGTKYAIESELIKRCARGRLAGQRFDPVMEYSADGKWMRARKPMYDGRGASEGRKVLGYEARALVEDAPRSSATSEEPNQPRRRSFLE